MIINTSDNKKKAAELGEISGNISSISGEIEESLASLPSVWTGSSADIFSNKSVKVCSLLRKRGKELSSIASGISSAMDRLEIIEDIGKALFSKL